MISRITSHKERHHLVSKFLDLTKSKLTTEKVSYILDDGTFLLGDFKLHKTDCV
jgi:hypothetical protein